jgi:hypothetical protein
MTKENQTSDEQIRTRAYYLWEADGRPQGRDQEYWHRAQKEMSARPVSTQPTNGNAKKATQMITDAKRKTSVKSPTYA